MTTHRDWGSAIDRQEPRTIADDKELTLLFQDGDDDAYAAIYEKHAAGVERVCRRMLGNSHDSQEAAQETFVRVYQALPRFNGNFELSAWISRIATNVCIDMLRARSRRPLDPAPLEVMEEEVESDEGVDPQAVHLRHFQRERVLQVLDDLPPAHRGAIVLRDFEGLSYVEIARRLNCSPAQVKALLHRARKGFRRRWRSFGAGFFSLRVLRTLKRPLPQHDSAMQAASATPHLSEVAAPSAQLIGSCSAMLHSCGQFVLERTAPAVAAGILGVTVAGGAATMSSSASSAPSPDTSVSVADEVPDKAAAGGSSVARGQGEPEPPEPAGEPVVSATPSPSPSAQPSPAPSPSPSPSPSPEPSPESSPDPPQDPQEPKPEPSPTYSSPRVAIGFVSEGSEGPRGSAPLSEPSMNEASCETASVDQMLTTNVHHEGSAYPGKVTLKGGKGFSFTLGITKGDRVARYSGTGVSQGHLRSDEKLTLAYEGDYRAEGPDAAEMGFPEAGRFSSQITIDCTSDEVTSESIDLAY